MIFCADKQYSFFVVAVVRTADKRFVQPEPTRNWRKRAVGNKSLAFFCKTALVGIFVVNFFRNQKFEYRVAEKLQSLVIFRFACGR